MDIESTAPAPGGATSFFQSARTRLLLWTGLMAAIYLGLLILFPLIPAINKPGTMLDIEMMLRARRWLAIPTVLGIGLLFFAYFRVMVLVQALSREDAAAAGKLRIWVLGAGLLCAVILLGLYPITAIDIALYVLHARRWVIWGGSPMMTVPADFPQEPYLALSGEYSKQFSPYGPLWEILARIPVQLGIQDIAGGILAMKVISLLAFLGMAWLIGWQAGKAHEKTGTSALTALAFFALNPFVLIQAIGNGHNDMVMLAFITLGLVLWLRDQWAWAALALTAASLIKATGLILMPLFGVAVIAAAPYWPARLKRAAGIGLIFLLTSFIFWRLMGPLPQVFEGTRYVLFNRTGYAPASALRMILREIFPADLVSPVPRTIARNFFIVYYAWLVLRLWQKRINLLEAGFLAFFSQLFLGPTFRIWYPLWLVPFAALNLTTASYWRTFLFSLTAELSILSYYILWRWFLRGWSYGAEGPLQPYWNFWTVMTLINVPWTFGIPLVIPLLIKRKDPERFNEKLQL